MNSPSDPTASPLAKPDTVPVRAASPKLLLRLWLLIFAVAVGCLLLYGLKDRVAWAQRSDEPEVYALLVVEKQDSRFPFEKQEKETEADFDRYLHTQAGYLKDRFTLNRALSLVKEPAKLPSLKDNVALDWLEKHLEVTIIEKIGILRVSLRSGNPEDNVAMVNAVIDAYLEITENENSAHQKARLMLLNDMAAKCEKNLADKRGRRRALAEVSNVSDRSSINIIKSLKEELDAYRKEHLRIKLALTTAKCTFQGKLKSLATANGNGPQKPDRAEQITQLKEEIAVLEDLEKQVSSDKANLQKQIDELPNDSLDISSSPSTEIEEQILKRIETARLDLEMEMQTRGRRVRIQQLASVQRLSQ
jgi:hypothetical protein